MSYVVYMSDMPYKDPVKARAYRRRKYLKHKERELDRCRQWQAENKEKCQTNQKRWAAANPDKIRRYSREWRAANPERIKAKEHARNADPAKREGRRQARRLWVALNPNRFRNLCSISRRRCKERQETIYAI